MKKDVLEELFRENYNGAVLYVYSLCKDYALSEDVVSTAFFKTFSVWEEGGSFKSFLFKVCKNQLFDHYRKRKRLVRLTADIPDGTDAAERLIADEEYRSLFRALELLKEEYREAITLFYFEDLSVAEIARITEKTPDNVKVTLFRARQKLKSILEDEK